MIDRVLTAATAVHHGLGPGLLESVYQKAMEIELSANGLAIAAQVPLPVFWRGQNLGIGFRVDLIVEGRLLVEIKAVQEILPIHFAQSMTYMKLLSIKRGYILNFHTPLMKKGIRRISI